MKNIEKCGICHACCVAYVHAHVRSFTLIFVGWCSFVLERLYVYVPFNVAIVQHSDNSA